MGAGLALAVGSRADVSTLAIDKDETSLHEARMDEELQHAMEGIGKDLGLAELRRMERGQRA